MHTCFAGNLWYLRTSRKETQAACAAAMGMSRSTYANYEAGINQPRLEMLEPFIRHFEVDAQDLLYSNLSEKKEALMHDDGYIDYQRTSGRFDQPSPSFPKLHLVTANHIANYASHCQNPAYLESLPLFSHPTLQQAQLRAFEVPVSWQLPHLKTGDIIIAGNISPGEINEDQLTILVALKAGLKAGYPKQKAGKWHLLSNPGGKIPKQSSAMHAASIIEAWRPVQYWTGV